MKMSFLARSGGKTRAIQDRGAIILREADGDIGLFFGLWKEFFTRMTDRPWASGSPTIHWGS